MKSTTRWAGAAGAIVLWGAPTTATRGADGLAPAVAVPSPALAAVSADKFDYGAFGAVSVYRAREPRRVVLFVSGDGGWNLGVVSMAQRLVAKGAIVAGVDIRRLP